MKFNGGSAGLNVNGILDAQGTGTATSEEVIFTSYKDDTGEDTNGDGSSSSPAANNWDYIKINSGASSTIAYAIIRYGGSSWGTNIYQTGCKLTLSHADISISGTALDVTDGTVIISSSTLHNHSNVGVYAEGAASLTITDSTISNNSNNAAYIDLSNVNSLTTSGNTATGNGMNGFLVTGTLGTDHTWIADTVAYVVSGNSPTDGSVHEGTIRWAGSTKYSDEWSAARATWNNENNGDEIEITAATSTTDLTVEDKDYIDGFVISWPALFQAQIS